MVRLTAPPLDNRANEVLRRLLASIWKSRLWLLESFSESAAGPSAWRCAERSLSGLFEAPLTSYPLTLGCGEAFLEVWLSSSDLSFFP